MLKIKVLLINQIKELFGIPALPIEEGILYLPSIDNTNDLVAIIRLGAKNPW